MPRQSDKIPSSTLPNVYSKRSFRQRRARSNLRQLRHLRQRRQLERTPEKPSPSVQHAREEKWYEKVLVTNPSPEKQTQIGLHKSEGKKLASTQKRPGEKNFLPERTRMRLLQKMKKVNSALRKLYEENEVSSCSEDFTSEAESDNQDFGSLFYCIDL